MARGNTKTPWMTRHQLEILQQIAKNGRRGILLWETDINLATIRSLARRRMIDTRKGNRIIATWAGKKRLRQPWPAVQPTGDQKDNGADDRSNVSEIDPAGSQAATGADQI